MNEKHPEDQQIDTALRVLGTAEPRQGMEQRILAAIHDAEQNAAAVQPGQRLRWPVLSLGAALALAMLGTVLQMRTTVSRKDTKHLQELSQRRPDTTAQSAQHGVMQEASVPQPKLGHTARERASSPVIRESVAQAEHTRTGQEPSFPAPPLPLTEQERSLLKLVHREAPVQLAQLTTSAREATVRREQDEVSQFFAPPKLLPEEQQ